jgi:hypothetical protein
MTIPQSIETASEREFVGPGVVAQSDWHCRLRRACPEPGQVGKGSVSVGGQPGTGRTPPIPASSNPLGV